LHTSVGGLYVRRYAQLFPADVAGMLLLDPAHEDFSAHLSEEARRFQDEWKTRPPMEFTPEVIEAFRPILAAMYADWPAEIREPLIERHLEPTRIPAGMDEGKNIEQLYDEIRQGPSISAIPLIVCTAMWIDASQRVFSPDEIIRAQNAAKLATNESLARSVPGAENRQLDAASHGMLHAQRPDSVIQGIQDLLVRIRRVR
jgi:pimeloyl-ACP methyl ester carboxylesterase